MEIKKQVYPLSIKTLQTIMSGGHVNEPVMQIIGCKKISTDSEKERFRLLLSDGFYHISCAILTVQDNMTLLKENIKENTIIKLKQYVTNSINTSGKDRRMLIILDVELIAFGSEVGEKIGNPIPLDEALSKGTSQVESFTNEAVNLKGQLLHPIPSLCPYNNKWVIRARVTNKSSIRFWSNLKGEGKLFSIDLMDEYGEIRATVFNDLVDKYYDIINVDKIYFINKCLLKHANKRFTSINHIFEITFTEFTQVQECFEEVQTIPKTKYDFVSIDKILHMENGTVIDVLGVCKNATDLTTLQSKTCRDYKKREITIMDQSNNAVVVTLWGTEAENFNFTDNAVIAIKGAKVQEYRGSKSLSLLNSSFFKINPNLPEVFQLRSWYNTNGYQVAPINISSKGGTLQGFQTWLFFKQAEYLRLGSGNTPDYYQLVGTILLMRAENSIYKACPTAECNKKVVDFENGFYRCEKCNKDYNGFKYRLLGSLLVADFSGHQWITVFNSDAENILEMTAQSVGLASETNADALINILENVTYKSFVFKCRVKSESYNDDCRVKTVAMKVDPINYHEYNEHLMSRINELLAKSY